MSTIFKPYPYQGQAIEWIYRHPRCGLFLDMGLGKSVITLTALRNMIDCCEIDRALVVAPKKVAETTWTTEAAKWAHTKSLRVSKVMGTQKKRIAALAEKADIYVVGRDNFVWLYGYYKGDMPFDVIVIDELTSFKTPDSQRFKAMRKASACVERVIGLTGTPAPNGLEDLWAQMYCIDLGERLGKSVTRYRDTYFDIYRHNGIPVRCTIRKGCEEQIRSKISDICISMQAKDYLQLPQLIVCDVRVELTEASRKGYEEFAREKVLELYEQQPDDDTVIAAPSAAALMNKLQQYANGAVYDSDHGVHEIHAEKLERLAELIEGAAGESVLVFYQFKHDIDRIRHRLRGLKVRLYKGETDLNDWNAGKIDVLLAHPASTAYGLNMQQGGRYIVWFGTGWDLELYLQANARLYRQGQTKPVTVYRLITSGTIDERTVESLEGKKSAQQGMLDALSELTRKYKG